MPSGFYPRPSPVVKFWKKTRITPGCWLWTGSLDRDGYGRLSVCCETTVQAHRFSYEIHFGKIPDGHGVLHKCDTPACVNPDHFFTGDNLANQRDCKEKGRGRTGEKNGRAILSTLQVEEIRRRVSSGETRRSLEKEFGVHKSTIGRVVRADSWVIS